MSRVAFFGLWVELHGLNIGKRGQDSFCCFLPESISQVINDCNESLVYVLLLVFGQNLRRRLA